MAICIDFDGVINTYTKYLGDDELFEPAPGVEEFLAELKEFGEPLVIHTARDAQKVKFWLQEHGLAKYIHLVTNEKIPAIVYIDDRGLKFEGDFKKTIEQLKTFSVWYKEGSPFQDWKHDETIYGTLEQRGILNSNDSL